MSVGGSVYEPLELLAAIDTNKWYVLSGFAIAMIFQCWWLGNAVLVARRDQVYSIPIWESLSGLTIGSTFMITGT